MLVYIDTSVVLAELFSEKKRPPASFWAQTFVSSRLLEYEILNRMHVQGAGDADLQAARRIVDNVQLADLSAEALARALEPFPLHVRTLDSLHLSTMVFLRAHGQDLRLATYDRRLAEAARLLGFEEAGAE